MTIVTAPASLLAPRNPGPCLTWCLLILVVSGNFHSTRPLLRTQAPGSAQCLLAPVAPDSFHGWGWLYWCQALRKPLQTQTSSPHGCYPAPVVPRNSAARGGPYIQVSFLCPRFLRGSHKLRPLNHSSTCQLPWLKGAPKAPPQHQPPSMEPGSWQVPMNPCSWLTPHWVVHVCPGGFRKTSANPGSSTSQHQLTPATLGDSCGLKFPINAFKSRLQGAPLSLDSNRAQNQAEYHCPGLLTHTSTRVPKGNSKPTYRYNQTAHPASLDRLTGKGLCLLWSLYEDWERYHCLQMHRQQGNAQDCN